MEEPQRRQEPGRDINDLLLNGYYRTARARSPTGSTHNNAPSFLSALDGAPSRRRSRSRSRVRRGPAPPAPTCEDEVVALAKELSSARLSDDEPPMRGILEQHPIILEADVTLAERERLHEAPHNEYDSDNSERRFVLVPKSEDNSPKKTGNFEGIKGQRERREYGGRIPAAQKEPEPVRKSSSTYPTPRSSQDSVKETKLPVPPPLERRRSSRQDLPALTTKVEKEIPPVFRRSASAYASSPRDNVMPRVTRTPSDYMLSPEAIPTARVGMKTQPDPTAQSSPRYQPSSQDAYWPGNGDKRSSGGSFSGASRPATPQSEKDKRAAELHARVRRNSNEKLTRSQQLTEEDAGSRHHRTHSTHSERPRSPRSSNQNLRPFYSSDEEIDSSDSERRRRRHRRHPSHSLRPDDDTSRHHRSPSTSRRTTLDAKVHSRYASPLPSPNVSPSQIPRADPFEPQRSDTFPRPRERISRAISPDEETPRASAQLNPMESAAPRSHSRQPSGNIKPQAASSQTSLPVPIPSRIDLHSPGETRRSPVIPQHDEPRSPGVRQSEAKPYWQPPQFQPPTNTNNLEKPVGSYRRFSEDIERGTIAPLPICPRTTFIRGRNDWLTLPNCPGFDICPTCYNNNMASTQFRDHFIPAPFRPSDVEVICDFGSSPWYRIAWLLTRKERLRDLNLFYGLASVAANAQPCLGKHEAVRQWHSIIDPRTGAPIRNFDACYNCVKSVETLLPGIRGLFVRIESDRPLPRICDLRFDSPRFIKYFDALETTADTADDIDGLDTRNIASLVKRLAMVDECEHGKDVYDQRWHLITQLPEFTVCEECYDEVVYPNEKRRAIPAMFVKSAQRLARASCQLYSPRMRAIFAEAVENDDYKYLAAKARERKAVELGFKNNMADLRRMRDVSPEFAARETARLTEEWRKWE
ncbi:ser arg-related nuclear matrix protein [Phlyctema vagabunda]|uniref:Ser arg-related nuclear matrix protein n=1 Tax=Phlyctema vagabunda TaxID=108571 RepID=A0ABR4PH18_9HELO